MKWDDVWCRYVNLCLSIGKSSHMNIQSCRQVTDFKIEFISRIYGFSYEHVLKIVKHTVFFLLLIAGNKINTFANEAPRSYTGTIGWIVILMGILHISKNGRIGRYCSKITNYFIFYSRRGGNKNIFIIYIFNLIVLQPKYAVRVFNIRIKDHQQNCFKGLANSFPKLKFW